MKKIKETNLGIKITGLLGIIIFVIILVYTGIFTRHYEAYEEKIIGEENINTLHSMEISLNTVTKNADDYSKMLVADHFIQEQMSTGELFSNISKQHEAINRIYAVLQFSDYVDAVWLIDNKGEKLTVGGESSISYENSEENTMKYKSIQKPYGVSQIQVNKKISLVRSYNSLDTFTSLGIIGVDINKEALHTLIAGIVDLKNEKIIVSNEKNDIIYQGGIEIDEKEWRTLMSNLGSEIREYQENVNINKKSFLASGIYNKKSGWKIIRYVPMQKSGSMSEMVRFNLVLIFIIGLLILMGAAGIARMMTTPIQKLLVCMKDVEAGKLTQIKEDSYLLEFRTLLKGYNHMVARIEELIKETIDRQRRIRQVEMNEIQEQMKPHFLYNTLNSIEALAMMGNTDKVCQLVEALGDFYRKSVSGGREFLTIKEEFKMAKDYVDIMKIRFGETFQCQIELDESCERYRIPKLTIQPLVENAFQHGIRAKKQYGIICLCCAIEAGNVHIQIRDNGAGIPEEIIQELATDKEPVKGKSLGLRGTIERLRQQYGEAFQYRIENKEFSEIDLYFRINVLEEKSERIESNID